MDIWQGVPLFKGRVIRANGPFFVTNSGWGGVISLLIVEILLKCVTVLVRVPPPPLPRGSWLVLSRIRPRYQVDTYLQSTVSSHVEKSRCGQLRKALSAAILSSTSANVLSPWPWCMFLQEVIFWTPTPPPGALSASTCILFLRV